MTPTALPSQIEAQIQGEISGQIAVGNYILQIGSIHGGVVNIAPVPAAPRLRPAPVLVRPRPFPGLLDRTEEIREATTALQSALPVDFYAPEGMGKTSLLRRLAYSDTLTDGFPHGVVYLSARHQTTADLLQALYDAFYESDTPVKSTQAQLRRDLQNRQALLLLDDVEWGREEVETLLNYAPASAFVLASTERRLWGEGCAVALRGLATADALTLAEKELGRPLSTEEVPAVQRLCESLGGNPLRIQQGIAAAREIGRPLVELAPAEAVTVRLAEARPESEQRVLAVLAALRGAPVQAAHVEAITGVADVNPVLEGLQRRHLAQAQEGRWSLPHRVVETWPEDLRPWEERLTTYFAGWVEEHRKEPKVVQEEAGAIRQALQYAIAQGRREEALRLARGLEGALALAACWDAWEKTLHSALLAARERKDQAAEAWALHQLGTRSLCLEERDAARNALALALQMREAQGDTVGAAITRHNLGLLQGMPPPGEERTPPEKPPVPPHKLPWSLLVVGAAVLLAVAIGLWGLWRGQEPEEGRPAPPPPRVENRVQPSLPPVQPPSVAPDGGAPRNGEEAPPGRPVVVVDPTSLDFGALEVGRRSRLLSITITNTGQADLVVEDVAITGEHAGDFVVRTPRFSLAPGGSRVIRVGFMPGAIEERRAVLTIRHNAGPHPAEVALAGRGAERPPEKRVRILFFRVQPDIEPGSRRKLLAYSVADARHARIEPEVGELEPNAEGVFSGLVAVSPRQTTRYTLTVVGFDGREVSETVVVRIRPTVTDLGRRIRDLERVTPLPKRPPPR